MSVLSYLTIHGPTTTKALHVALRCKQPFLAFGKVMRSLSEQGWICNVAGPAGQGGLGFKALWVVREADVPAKPCPSTMHIYPRYCLDPVARAPQHSTHVTTAWVPPAMGCTRAGAQDFLALPSRVGEERRPHTASYVAALAGPRQPRAQP